MKRLLIVVIIAAVALITAPLGSADATTVATTGSYSTAQLESMASSDPAVVDVESASTLDTAATTSSTTCWGHTSRFYHGTWPQQHNEFVYTHWCMGNSSHLITSRNTTINSDVLFCSFDTWGTTRLSGGSGYDHVTIQADSYFSCPTGIPWLNLHFHEWAQIKYAWGGYVAVINRN